MLCGAHGAGMREATAVVVVAAGATVNRQFS